jgi:23S rRNA pseudouridine2605 synthase
LVPSFIGYRRLLQQINKKIEKIMTEIKKKKVRLNKFLAEGGVGSRRYAEELIRQGRVKINGEMIFKLGTNVDPSIDKVFVDDEPLRQVDEKVYFVLNKPKGYLCSNRRVYKDDRLVIDLFSHLPYRVFTVGRLDKDTRGLIIVTNHGEFAQQVIHPSAGLTKEYLVKTLQEITHEHLIRMSEGTVVEDVHVKPLSVTKVRKGTFKIVVGEGRKREVRLIAAAAGLAVESLTRIRIGNLQLGGLPIGHYRPLGENEQQELLSAYSRRRGRKPKGKATDRGVDEVEGDED